MRSNDRMKRTKTFTGCWTCRRRRIKCDESRPRCRQCMRKGLDCEGYHARLQWLTPETGSAPDAATSPKPEVPQANLHRRRIPVNNTSFVLRANEIDGIISALDSVEENQDMTEDGNAAHFIQCFGIFKLAYNRPSEPHSQESTAAKGHRSPDPQARVSPAVDQCRTRTNVDLGNHRGLGFAAPDDSPSHSVTEAAEGLCDLSGRHSPAATPIVPVVGRSPATASSILEEPESDLFIPHPTCLPDQSHSDGVHRLQTSPLPEREQLLMKYYAEIVVHLFCIVDYDKSPWKTIHLPLVLQSIGELTTNGSTSRIRGALRNALLSISGYYLSNSCRRHGQTSDADLWADAASDLRYKAIGLLKEAMKNDLYSQIRPKYKDFLATTLSMITINIMSGDTSTCGIHLQGATQLIRHMKTFKTKYSPKARALHRIFFFLHTIYESTALRDCSTTKVLALPSPEVGPPESDIESESIRDVEGIVESSAFESVADITSFEHIYGMPPDLLVLLKESTGLINRIDESRRINRTSSIPSDLLDLCDDLERRIMDWDVEENIERFQLCCARSNIMCLQTRAFHNALMIYFSQHIRLLNYRYYRQHIRTVLDCVEKIEKIKADTQILAAPVFWPVFIAASEAFEDRYQERFRRWYQDAEMYGIEGARTGSNLLFELWEHGTSKNDRMTSTWRALAEQRRDMLMLT